MLESRLNFCSVYFKQGAKGPYQDSLVAWEGFLEQRGCILGGVFDGHGNLGRQISLMVRDNLPMILAEALERVLEDEGNPSDFCHVAGEAMLLSFKSMERKIVTELKMQATSSGCTAIAAFIQAGQLLVSNLGDSRCVLATTGINGKLQAVQITEDLQPSVPSELARIQEKHGRVVSFPGNPPTLRMIHPDAGGMGLSVSRSFGDTLLKKYGLSAEPQLLYHRIRPEDKFLVLASDGLWRVMSNEEAVEIVSTAASRKKAAEALVQRAVQLWQESRAGSHRDDITAVVIHLEGLSSRLLQKLVSLRRASPSTWQRFLGSWSRSSRHQQRPVLQPTATDTAVVAVETVPEEENEFGLSMSEAAEDSIFPGELSPR